MSDSHRIVRDDLGEDDIVIIHSHIVVEYSVHNIDEFDIGKMSEILVPYSCVILLRDL